MNACLHQSLSRVQLFAIPWTVARQASLSMEFSRQEYWSGFPFPSPGDLPESGIKPRSAELQVDSLPFERPFMNSNPNISCLNSTQPTRLVINIQWCRLISFLYFPVYITTYRPKDLDIAVMATVNVLQMNVKEENEQVGLKLNIQKTKIRHLVPSLYGKQMGKQWNQWQILFWGTTTS